MAEFVDRVVVHVSGGSGGHGCASVHREKFKPLGGPDGADGGHGGDVIFEVSERATTLLSFHRSPHLKAQNGTPGQGNNRLGKNGEDLVLEVPEGTIVKDREGNLLADLTGIGTTFVAARGGIGGRGNASLASKQRKAPGFALLGTPGEERDLVLELKSVADVALVGYPSAGKSSLIAAMSSARPKIADYPFTTLIPNLGVVQAGTERFTVADVPGLIPGASQGKGLGLDFLRHIERCAVIVHVLDTATFEVDRNPLDDLRVIEAELESYRADLGELEGYVPLPDRPRLVVLNKIDIPDGRDLAEIVIPDLEAAGYDVLQVSAVSHEGLETLKFRLAELVREHRANLPEVTPEDGVIRIIEDPSRKRRDGKEITVIQVDTEDGPVFQVLGDKAKRWVQQTDFTNDEAVGYLSDRFNRAGVEDQLMKLGARAGDTVIVGDDLEEGVVFDWEPSLATGVELLGARGTDLRLDESHRRTNQERRREYHEMMDAKARAREELWTDREQGIWTDPGQE